MSDKFMRIEPIFDEESVTASGYAYSKPIRLADRTDDGSRYSIMFSYIPSADAGIVSAKLSYETSYFKDNGYFTQTTIVSGTSVSGSFQVEDASNAAECVISGSAHGMTTGDYIQLGDMGNEIGWGKERGNIYRITATDVDNLVLQGKNTVNATNNEFGTFAATVSGTPAHKAYVYYTNFDPTWDTPWIRFRVDETYGTDTAVIKAYMMVQ